VFIARFGIDVSDSAVKGAIVTGVFALSVAGLGWILTRLSARRDTRRNLHSEAYKAALAWREMLYRVRRRPPDDTANWRLIDRFHELQEELDYYQGWLCTESRYLGHSYSRMVGKIKTECEPRLVAAWKAPLRDPSEGAPVGEDHPQITETTTMFLRDVRSYLSFWQLPKLFVMWRNRKWFEGDR
jgi:hypothetical protein